MGGVASKIKHGFEDVGHDIVHGAEDVGKFVAHGAKDVVHGAEDVGKFVAHGAKDVGKFVVHRAENVYHAADDVVHGNFSGAVSQIGDAAKAAINDASHAVTTVGDVVAHGVSLIPVVGGTLSKGIDGVTDLSKMQTDVEDDAIHAIEHPIDAVKSAVHAVSTPGNLLHTVMKGVHQVQRASGDISNIAGAVGTIDPALAPEVKLLQGVTGVIAHPTVSGALNEAATFVPEGSKVAKVIKVAQKADKYAQKAEKVYKGAQNIGAAGAFAELDHVMDLLTYHNLLRAQSDELIGYHLLKNGEHTGSLYEQNGRFAFFPPNSSV